MTRRGSFLLVVAILLIALAGCHKVPGLGFLTETYVNQNNPGQTLELQSKETLKGLVHGVSSPGGSYTLFNGQTASTGKFGRIKGTYILTPAEDLIKDHPGEIKLALKDDSLIDVAGNVWRLQSRSHAFRPAEPAVLSQALHER